MEDFYQSYSKSKEDKDRRSFALLPGSNQVRNPRVGGYLANVNNMINLSQGNLGHLNAYNRHQYNNGPMVGQPNANMLLMARMIQSRLQQGNGFGNNGGFAQLGNLPVYPNRGFAMNPRIVNPVGLNMFNSAPNGNSGRINEVPSVKVNPFDCNSLGIVSSQSNMTGVVNKVEDSNSNDPRLRLKNRYYNK